MFKKIILYGFSAFVLITGGTYLVRGYRARNDSAETGAIQRERTAVVSRGNLSALVSAMGKIEPILQVEVKSKASGEIIEMPVEVGDPIQKGALIARIDETESRMSYDQTKADLDVARASLNEAESKLKRQEELYRGALIAKADLDQAGLEAVRARAQLVKAKTQLELMESRLKDCVVRAPITGIVLQKFVQAGQIISSGLSSVSGGTTLAVVADLNQVYVHAQVDEVDIGQVRIGHKAKIAPDAFPSDIFAGTVLRISPLAQVEQNVTTFDVTLLVQNPDQKLKAGMNASVDLIVAFKDNVLLVPRQALRSFPEIKAYLASLGESGARGSGPEDRARGASRGRDGASGPSGPHGAGEGPSPGMAYGGAPENGKAARMFAVLKTPEGLRPRPVETGAANTDKVEVTAGLSEGDTIVVLPSSRADMDRKAFQDRMKSMSGFGAFGGSPRGMR